MKIALSIMFVVSMVACDVVINIQQQESTKEVEVVIIPTPTQPMGKTLNTSKLPDPMTGYHWETGNTFTVCAVGGCDFRTCPISQQDWVQVKDFETLTIYSSGNIGGTTTNPNSLLEIHGDILNATFIGDGSFLDIIYDDGSDPLTKKTYDCIIYNCSQRYKLHTHGRGGGEIGGWSLSWIE